jgi:predicted ester cyclase
MMKSFAAMLILVVAVFDTPAWAADLKVDDLIIAKTQPDQNLDANIKTAKAFYEFWNTGEEQLLKTSISPSFVDHTLPNGRPQGPEGPAVASKTFRAAVPDLNVEVIKMIVTGDWVTVHMEFRGHFTGRFGSTQGNGQTIHFIATDLLKISANRITDNWHIEDNLTLLSQMGVAKVTP